MDYRLSFFRGAGDIFDAIAVAASDHPVEAGRHRPAPLHGVPSAVPPTGGTATEAPPPQLLHPDSAASFPSICSSEDGGVPCREDPVAAETECIKAVLLNDQEKVILLSFSLLHAASASAAYRICSAMLLQLEAMLFELLRRLQQLELTVDTLTVTEIGKAVSSYRKHNSKQIRHLSSPCLAQQIAFLLSIVLITATQVSVMNRSISGQKKVSFLPVKPHTKEIINNINFMPWSDVCFVTGGSDHAVNKKMIHGTTRKCTRICILLLSWVLLDYSKKKIQYYQLTVTRGLYHLICQLEE
uniref:TFIIS N-terminal domain-containing protein n=1 Tax=Oryza glumipatula TaxID=40148 RepID=A0A0D9ZBI4_9ORYZ